MDLKLTGKRALITGGSKGIGLATAQALAAEGAEVTIVARTAGPLEEAATLIYERTGKRVLTLQADVASEEEATRAVQHSVEHWGGIDILINNAGTSFAQPFEAIEAELWDADLGLKLMGAVFFARAVVPHMKAAGGGAIVNVTAVKGKAPTASSLPTSVSRAAGLALTKAMSHDLAPHNIRVNAVCIGLIRSAQIEAKWQQVAPQLSWEEFSANPAHGIPLGRIGEAAEAAQVIAFLASGATSYVTGTAVNIDGGSAPVL